MKGPLRKMLLRSIRGTLGRYLAIFAIVALGIGFYAGLKSSQPDLLSTVDAYYREHRMVDLQLMSSLGFTEEDEAAFRALPGVSAAEGACFADAYARIGSGSEEVWHIQTLTAEVATPALLAGRMPADAEECLGDSAVFDEEDLGKTLVLTDSNDEETLGHFSVRSFTLVGIANSPRYLSADRGGSALGSGTPEGFLLVPREAFSDGVFHELLLWLDLPGAVYSAEYGDALRHLRPGVETLLNLRGVLRQAQLREEKGRELADARKALDEGWLEYRIGARQSELELKQAEQQLQSAEKQLKAGFDALEASEKTLEETEQQALEDQLALETRQTSLTETLSDLATRRAALNAELVSILAERSGLEARKNAELSGCTAQLASLYVQILALQTDPEGNAFAIAALQAQRDTVQAELNALQNALENPGEGEDRWYADGLKNTQAREAECREALEALDGEAASLSGEMEGLLTEMMTVRMTGEMLPESRALLEENRSELNRSATELAAGRAQYEAGKETAEKELAEARRKLEDGEKDYAEGEAAFEEALRLDLYTLDRTANAGYVTFENDSAIIDGIAVVFPVFFVLVAALVCVTTMTRMVNEERTQFGTLKALGYGNAAIMAKYLLYAGSSAFLGCVIGFFAGCTGLPYIVWFAYNIIYRYSPLLYHFSLPMFLACLLVAVAGSLLVTWLACRSALREKPAELIRPRAPAAGKRVLLERLPLLWSRLPFLAKTSLRNAFRHPSRVLMMLLGIGGCTALMVAGFGAKDSLANVGNYQYDEISLYDLVVTLDSEKAGSAPALLWEDWSACSALTHREAVRLRNPEGEDMETSLLLADAESVTGLLSLHDHQGRVFPWPGEGEVLLTRKLSENLHLRAGDSACLLLSDGSEKTVTVSGVCEYYVGHHVFASPGGFPDASSNQALIRVKEGEDAALRAAGLRSGEGVSYVSLTQTERDTLESSMDSIDLLVLMLVFCSGALAFITLYNLTNINLLERIREVATVKVLGFTPRETAEYILNENLLLSFLGAGLGLLLGKFLHRFVMDMIRLDYMSYDIRIAPLSFVLSFVITLVFAVLTNLFMRRKLEAVNMAESLKSVE